MSPLRHIADGLTGDEIEGKIEDAKSKIKDFVRAEMRDEMRAQNEILEKQNVVLDKIADGAQAQILSATLLHGNAEIGLKGVLPDVQERLRNLEQGIQADREVNEAHHQQNSGRLDQLEKNQHRMRRVFKWCFRQLAGQIKDSDADKDKAESKPPPPWAKWLLVGGVAGWHWVWAYLKKFLLYAHLLSK